MMTLLTPLRAFFEKGKQTVRHSSFSLHEMGGKRNLFYFIRDKSAKSGT